ncbi:M56 family metallopeptidase [Changchengzhania lutea]|uniref:M56 family metallopeptidase n=1 Tax=Changchengzhania lutea TaxID=2049305 RepID=UPI00163D406F|nr:M56 family metallopeptidase [Changchengzhania lutea]
MEYLLKVSALTIIFYTCYKVFLERDTFFESNRWFLLLGLLSAFVIPFYIIPNYIEYTPVATSNYSFNEVTAETNKESFFNFTNLLLGIYISGVIVFAIRFLIQLKSLVKLFYRNTSIKQDGFKLIETRQAESPFSFFHYIVYNPKDYSSTELNQILMHEKVHAQQYHSIDNLFSQICCILLWFNPLIWLYNNNLKQNLEFIADQTAHNNAECKKSYQYTLLKSSIPNYQLALTNNFYNSLIKKRIVMLHKSKSKKINQLKYALVLPLVALFLMGFNTQDIYVKKENTAGSLKSQPPIVKIERSNKLISDDVPIIENSNDFVPTPIKSRVSTKQSKVITPVKTPLKKEIETVIIIKGMTDAELANISKNFKKLDVTLTFKGIKRNGSGDITAIKINVQSKSSQTNYYSDSDKPINPIQISFNKENNSISIGNGHISKKHKYNYVYATNGKLKSKKGHGIVVTSSDNHKGENEVEIDDDNDNEFEYKVEVNEDEDGKDGKDVEEDEAYEIIYETATGNNGTLMTDNDEEVYETETKEDNDKQIRFVSKTNEKPLYIINGKISTKQNLDDLKSDDIKSVNVIKGKSATEKYGKKAKDGVIEITTKQQY